MKKKFSLTPVTIALPVLLLVLVLYCLLYFLPSQNELTALRAAVSLSDAQIELYQQYLSDTSPLEDDIASIQAEIDQLNSEGYTNDSTVSFVISDAIQRYHISLSSISLDSVTTYDGHRVLPIQLSIKGTQEDILSFIAHFEGNEEGSYLVRGASLETNGTVTTASLTIYLCTPNQ